MNGIDQTDDFGLLLMSYHSRDFGVRSLICMRANGVELANG